MCGCLSGTLPQLPQQNVFLGLPLELMTEEVALLLEKGASYVVDDVQAHTHGLNMMMDHGKRLYLRAREEACLIEAIAYQKSLCRRTHAEQSGTAYSSTWSRAGQGGGRRRRRTGVRIWTCTVSTIDLCSPNRTGLSNTSEIGASPFHIDSQIAFCTIRPFLPYRRYIFVNLP
jgi:hypothetical protein